jgi:cellulose synthase/poly-beta-1,6-N-acetylglucosamine synthase-like glycosyltransferase
VNGLYVTPGPFSIFRARIFSELGVLRPAHDTEDMEIALRMQKAGWQIQNAPRARVYTTAPKTARGLLKQRTRWMTGFLRNSIDYREMFFNPRFGVVGLMILPLGVASIFSRIGLFSVSIERTVTWLWEWFANTLSVPLSFAVRVPTFDWFFAPVSAITILSLVTLGILLGLMVMGSRISHTKTKMGPALAWYLILYGAFAFVWLTRSVVDVAFGIRRSWR